MKLQELLKDVAVTEVHADLETEVASIVYDSRKAVPGCLFAAISGFASDGNRFIPMAVEKGAVVTVTAKKPDVETPYVLVASDRLALAQMACNFYGNPAKSMQCIGITGTNGKTSVTLLLKSVLEQTRGAKVGLIGTMGNLVGQEAIPSERTTPESLELQQLFARMRDAGCTYAVMEVSSHAIALDRIGGVHYDVAAFTNLTEDHLDFHKTMDAYCDTKAELFRRCDRAVINQDDPYASRMLQAVACPVLTFSAHKEAGLYAKDIALHAQGVEFTAVCGEETAHVVVPIPGRFTVYNALTVLGVSRQLGISLEECAGALGKVFGVKGRIEVVPTPGMPYTVLIDYAHTPDALENVLKTVRGFAKGRLIAVFGCGGDREKEKRPLMGRIAAELADVAVVTSDNPRSEEPMAIIQDILTGIAPTGKKSIIEPDRRAAIALAMKQAGAGDVIILCGKGHETYQEIGGRMLPMDEREIVQALL